MASDLSIFSTGGYGDALKELERLLSQPHRAFLLGAGCSKCAGLPLTSELTAQVEADPNVSDTTKKIVTSLKTAFNGSKPVTIEDYLSELVDLLSIAERRQFCGAADTSAHIGKLDFTIDDVKAALKELKQGIVAAINRSDSNIETHRRFIKAIHKALQSGKAGSAATVDYYVLNYDTLIEDALGIERLSVADGFSGAATGWWDENSLATSGVQARVLKVHGSVDWYLMDDDVLPHRIRPPSHGKPPSGERVVIWPAATKYRETQRDPYAQILKHIRCRLRPPEKSELVLAICGYRFADLHINLELQQALGESRGGLTIIAFTEDESPTGALKEWLDDPAVRDQVRVYARRGFFHGKIAKKSDSDLPWWKFEVLTRLLGGER